MNSTYYHILSTVILSLLGTLTLSANANAPADENPTLEFMTITAARTAQADVAASISSIDEISFTQATHINEIMSQSAGTWISRGNGQEHLTAIRSPVLTGGGSCAAFYMSEDNIPLRATAFCNVNQLFDVNYEQAQSIEVLRGPGTAFQGNGAVHGVINVRSPDFSAAPATTLSAMAGSHDYQRLGLDHRDDRWMLQAHIDNDGGYKDDSGYEQQKLRFKALQTGSNWSLTHALNLANLDQDTATYVEGADAYKDPDRKKENPNPDAYRKAKSLRFSSDFRMHPKADSEFIFTPYVRSNEMEFLMHFQPGTPVEENGHHSLGFQSAYIRPYNDNIRLSSGFDIDYSRGFLKQTQTNADIYGGKFPQGEHYDYEVSVQDVGMFVQADAKLAEFWDLSAGLRIAHARYKYANQLSNGSACDSSVIDCRYYRPADDNQNFFDWSPRVSLQYEYTPRNVSYINLSRGYRAPHSSDLYRLESGQESADIDSEQLDALEWGFKGIIANRASYQLSAFVMRKDNVIVKTNDRERADGQKTKHQGVELEVDYPIINNLIFSLAASYAKHQYNSNVRLLNSSTEIIKDNIIDTAPRHMHNARLTWLISHNSEVQLEGVYLGDYYLDADNSFSYDGHTLANLRFSQTLPAGWNINFAVINATDEDYADRADITFGTPSDPSEPRYFIGEPRNYRFTINKQF